MFGHRAGDPDEARKNRFWIGVAATWFAGSILWEILKDIFVFGWQLGGVLSFLVMMPLYVVFMLAWFGKFPRSHSGAVALVSGGLLGAAIVIELFILGFGGTR